MFKLAACKQASAYAPPVYILQCVVQVVPTGWPVFSVAWSSKQRILVAGGNSVLHIFKVDVSDAIKLKHARHGAQGLGISSVRQQQLQAKAVTTQVGGDNPQVCIAVSMVHIGLLHTGFQLMLVVPGVCMSSGFLTT